MFLLQYDWRLDNGYTFWVSNTKTKPHKANIPDIKKINGITESSPRERKPMNASEPIMIKDKC